MSKVTITVEVDAEALRTLLSQAEEGMSSTREEMQHDDRHGYGIYTDEDRATFERRVEATDALSRTLLDALAHAESL